jgi:serine/threonine protein kinase
LAKELDFLFEVSRKPESAQHIGGFLGCVKLSDDRVIIIQDLLGNDLFDLIHNSHFLKEKSPFERWRFYLDIMRHVEFLEKEGYQHCDLKPENIITLLLSNKYSRLIDFGFATKENCTGGTLEYAPPEFIFQSGHLNGPVNKKKDVFSLGIIFIEIEESLKGHSKYEMIDFLKLPFNPERLYKADFENKFEGFRNSYLGLKERINPLESVRTKELKEEFVSIVKSMIAYYPKDRSSLTESVQKLQNLIVKSEPPSTHLPRPTKENHISYKHSENSTAFQSHGSRNIPDALLKLAPSKKKKLEVVSKQPEYRNQQAPRRNQEQVPGCFDGFFQI